MVNKKSFNQGLNVAVQEVGRAPLFRLWKGPNRRGVLPRFFTFTCWALLGLFQRGDRTRVAVGGGGGGGAEWKRLVKVWLPFERIHGLIKGATCHRHWAAQCRWCVGLLKLSQGNSGLLRGRDRANNSQPIIHPWANEGWWGCRGQGAAAWQGAVEVEVDIKNRREGERSIMRKTVRHGNACKRNTVPSYRGAMMILCERPNWTLKNTSQKKIAVKNKLLLLFD